MGYTSAAKIPDRWVSTTCGYCSVGCGMFIGVKDGRAVSVRGNPDHPVNRGVALSQGARRARDDPRRGTRAVSAAAPAGWRATRQERSTSHRALTRVGWHEAIETMARTFREVQAAHGPESVGVHQHRAARHRGVLHARQARAARPRHAPIRRQHHALHGDSGLGLQAIVRQRRPARARTRISSAPTSSCSIGANIADNHPILWQRLEANRAKTLIVVDPRVTKTAMLADLHLPLKPRSDLALINGLIHIVIEHDLIDREYIAAHTTGFDALRESVREYTPEHVASDHRAVDRGASTRRRWLYANARARSSAGRWG